MEVVAGTTPEEATIDTLVPDAWTRRLAAALASAIAEAAAELRGVPVVRLAVDCHPWNGILLLAVLTAAEADADAALLDPREMAAWDRHAMSDRLPAWALVEALEWEMRAAYESAAQTAGDHKVVAEAYFRACAAAAANPEVAAALDLFERDPRFRVTITHPDNNREFYPPGQ